MKTTRQSFFTRPNHGPLPEEKHPRNLKSDPEKVFNHVHQLLMNDEFLEDYVMLFGKHKDRIIIEIPVDRS